jgi:hypothetical protein
MASERIQEGYQVFVSDAVKPFGAVRQVLPHCPTAPELVVYVENAGDFTVALSAVQAIHAQKVIVGCGKRDHRLRKAIGHVHDAEDPSI